MLKVCLVLLCFTLASAKFEGNDDDELGFALRKLLDGMKDQNSEELNDERRLFTDDDDDEADMTELDFVSDKRANTKSDLGRVITLENRAAMSARLRILYTDENGIPFLVESGRILTQQSKSVSVSTTAKVVKVLVDREMFIDTWRNSYTVILEANAVTPCFRIIGTIFTPKVKACPKDD